MVNIQFISSNGENSKPLPPNIAPLHLMMPQIPESLYLPLIYYNTTLPPLASILCLNDDCLCFHIIQLVFSCQLPPVQSSHEKNIEILFNAHMCSISQDAPPSLRNIFFSGLTIREYSCTKSDTKFKCPRNCYRSNRD